MFKRLSTIEKLLEKLSDDANSKLHDIDKTLVKQEENLKEHMRRTELAEKRLDAIEQDLRPVKKHIARLDGVAKFLGFIALIVGIFAGVAKFLSFVI
jgi:hypothetical protein